MPLDINITRTLRLSLSSS